VLVKTGAVRRGDTTRLLADSKNKQLPESAQMYWTAESRVEIIARNKRILETQEKRKQQQEEESGNRIKFHKSKAKNTAD